MRLETPRGLDDFRGSAKIAFSGQETSGQRCRRHEVRRELHGVLRARQGCVGVTFDTVERVGSQQHRPVALGRCLVEQPEGCTPFDRIERAAPIAVGAAGFEHRIARPGGGRRDADRLAGIFAGGIRVATPARFDEEAAQTKNAGFVLVHHFGEGGFGGGAVARDLGGLCLQQQGQGLAPEKPFGLARIATRRDRIAGADRHHAARDGLVALGPAAGAGREGQARGKLKERGDSSPQERQPKSDGDQRDRCCGNRSPDFITTEGHQNGAGTIGQPDGAEGRDAEETDENESAPHAGFVLLEHDPERPKHGLVQRIHQ